MAKGTKGKKKELITCPFPQDKFNSRAAHQWLKTQTGAGREGDLSSNKRTLLRLFGAKKSK